MFLEILFKSVFTVLSFLTGRQHHRRLQLEASIGPPPLVFGGVDRRAVYCRVSNPTDKPVTLGSFSWVFPSNRQMVWGQTVEGYRLPYDLSPGRAVIFGAAREDIVEFAMQGGSSGAVRLVPICIDQTGRLHRGGPYSLTLPQ